MPWQETKSPLHVGSAKCDIQSIKGTKLYVVAHWTFDKHAGNNNKH